MAKKRTIESHVPPPEPPPVEPDVYEPMVPELIEEATPPVAVVEYGVDDHGRLVAPLNQCDRTITVGGARYEHVCETDDGRWVYAKS